MKFQSRLPEEAIELAHRHCGGVLLSPSNPISASHLGSPFCETINTTSRGEHIMNCPVCNNVNLVMSERQGIEIDYCPQCRGVWLDRGELDKIIDRSSASAPMQKNENPPPSYNPTHNYEHQSHSQGGHYKKKREGFLSEMFDFD